MASSSSVQLIGYLLALIGLSCTIAATLMVEWQRVALNNGEEVELEGLWTKCLIKRFKISCDHPYRFIGVPTEVQATRAVMLLSILFSISGALVIIPGLKCTNCLDGNKKVKNSITMAAGICFMIAGCLALSITTWFASNFVQTFPGEENQDRYEFGSAMFVSWGGAIISMLGGAFLCCRCPKQSMRSPIKHPKLRPVSGAATDYV